MSSMRPLFASVRVYRSALLACEQDPAVELLAMVWGPRFDREHARQLAQSVLQDHAALERSLAQAADHFDRLPPSRQQRLRKIIRHHAGGTISA